ncbi:MAG: ATP-binding protein [Desulfobacula sp.]|nr:ATP-binding protein [Desulfobacula sp.]
MNIYSLYRKLTIEDIRDFISSMQEENLNLDFKTISNSNLTNKDDKKNLAKSLSAYANSSGGLIIWGVVATKNKQGIDCATGLKEIENIRLFLSRLNEFTGMAVSPIVDDVQHRFIETSPNKGVAITYVPESISGPHMAKMGEDRYYKRSGDSFYRLEHFDLEDMFGRRPRPILELNTRITGYGLQSNIIIGIKNVGRGSAKAPYIAFGVSLPFRLNRYGLDGNYNEGMKKLPYLGSELPNRYGEGSNVVIHPGIIHEVASVHIDLVPKETQKPTSNIVIEYELAAEGFMTNKGSKVITLEELGIR